MKLEPPKNQNYCATVVRVQTLLPLSGLDNLVALPVFGYHALVPKTTQIGDVGVVFPAEVQLSEAFAKANNLHRHAHLNEDQEKVGYLEDTRRVKALKLRGHRSDALFLPLSCLDFTGSADGLGAGDEFDRIGDIEICRKYSPRRTAGSGGKKTQAASRVDTRAFPEHFDTANWFKVEGSIAPDVRVVLTQKLHGTSIRIGNPRLPRKLSLLERAARAIGVRVDEFEYSRAYGSRKVVKDPRDPWGGGFYGTDLWTEEGAKVALLPEGYVVYGEVVGWVGEGAAIQSGFTYDCEPGTRRLYVYRVAHVTPSGYAADLSWDAVKQFCAENGLSHVPEIARCDGKDAAMAVIASALDAKLHDTYPQAVPLSTDSPCDEGVCVRIEGIVPRIYKAKSPLFLQHESKALDKGETDTEEAAS